MMQVAKKVPFDDPNVLNACRALYVFSNLVILGIYLYLKTAIDKKKGMCILCSSNSTLHATTSLRMDGLLWRYVVC